MRYSGFLFGILFFIAFTSSGQTIFDLNAKLGRGINYGNMFEAPTETEWGNPWQPEYPGIIADLGFDHVRMPIRWETSARSSAVAPYTIQPAFLARIKEVVDATLDEKLMIVINMHHHEALFENPDGNKARFLAQWQQISAFFKDYPDSLVFELMNEPHGGLTPAKWNEFLLEALDVIRVDNPTRAVMVGTAEYGGLSGLSSLELPDDDHLIVTVHYYNPFPFTHQGAEWVENSDPWLGTEWTDSDLERAVVEDEVAALVAFSEAHHVPVHMGEFGAYSKADIVSREKWTTYLGRYFESLGWSWAYWEFSAGFGVYHPGTETYVDELVDALLHNPMPEPATYERTNVYQSNFTTGTDGWVLHASGGANAQLAREGNAIKVTINSLGTENWHIQLVKNNVALQADKKYAFTFTGSGTASRYVSNYMGMSVVPWSQYGSIGVTVTETADTYSGVFDMATTDATARLVFDLGNSLEDFTVTHVKVESLVLASPVDPPLSVQSESNMLIYPNPVQGFLHIHNTEGYSQLTVINVHGQILSTFPLQSGINTIDMQNIPKGLCFVRVANHKSRQVFKVLNQ